MHFRHVHYFALAATFAIASQTSLAQPAASSASDSGPVPEGRGKDRANKIIERFKAADTNRDGKLTRAEAQGKMPMVFRNFDKIDADKKGYVTLDDIANAIDKQPEPKHEPKGK